MPNVFSHPYQLDESIPNFRVVEWYFFIQILKETSVNFWFSTFCQCPTKRALGLNGLI